MRVINTADLSRPNGRDEAWVYNGLDCCVTYEVFEAISPQLDNATSGVYNFSRELQAPVLEMMLRGTLVDEQRRQQVLKAIRTNIEQVSYQLDRIISEGVGVNVNWRSPSQLVNLFYDVMRLPPKRKRNAQGRLVPTANREAIEHLSNYLPAEAICTHLLALRDLDKKRQFLETQVDDDGRIRCNFNIAGTRTGRLASSISDFGTGTNLQNIERELRSVFVPDEGMVFCNVDLEQADARNVGAVCWNLFVHSHGERYAGGYLDTCESGDLHTAVCRMAWSHLDWSGNPRQTADQTAYRHLTYRDLSKKLGHGTNYYGQPGTMSKHTKVPRPIIEDFQREYFCAFPVIGTYDKRDHTSPTWHNHVRATLKDSPVITTLLGRPRRFFGRPNDEETLRDAIAYEPQSLTADQIDLGLLAIWRAQLAQTLIQVHDSILVQIPEEAQDEIIPQIIEAMKVPIILEKGREFMVPLEAKVGHNWGDHDDKKNPDGLKKWRSATCSHSKSGS